MTEQFFEKLREIDALVASGPSGVDYESDLSPLIADEVSRRYFYERLESPAWLEFLSKAGAFREPPQARNEGKGLYFPFWPPSDYVRRMARFAPRDVWMVICEIPETNNNRVHLDLAEATFSLATKQAAQWAMLESAWVASQQYLYLGLGRTLGRVISRMASGAETDAALALAKSLLTLVPNPHAEGKNGEQTPIEQEPVARLDPWDYEQILKENIPDLVNAAGDRAFALLCDLLDRAVEFSQRSNLRPPEDLSYIWRPAIEDHDQNLGLGLKQILVVAVRNAAQQLANNELAGVLAVVRVLEERGRMRKIFSRIALYLLRMFPDAALEQVSQRLMSHELFSDTTFRHEYFLLAEKRFGRLTSDQQSVILGWIENGPDIDSYKKWREEATGRESTSEDAERYRRYWQLERLTPIAGYLEREWKERYSKLVDELGEPEHPEFSTYISGGAFGPISPETDEDLGKMSLGDLVNYLKSWQPSGDPFHNASPEGLGRQLSSMVASKPDFYSKNAKEFELEEPTYVRGFIQGFWDAAKQGSLFEWEPVLNLCKWAVGRQREIPGREVVPLLDKDPDWGATRMSITRLLSDAFQSDKGYLAYTHRALAWELLEELTSDPDPDPKSEQRYVGGGIEEEYAGSGMNVRGYDPVTYAMNTVRGEAMSCVIKYALWVRQFIETQPDGKDLVARGLDEMPEVRAVLDKHLDVKYDPSIAVRSVYGERFPLLYHLDSAWASESAGRIFPAESSLQNYFDAAWDAYVVFNRPFDVVLEALKNEYARVVERIGEPSGERERTGKPYGRLAEHLMTFYWWGTLNLESPLITRFYEKADPKLRGHALEFIGRSFRNADQPIQPEVTGRVKALWEARVEALRKEGSQDAARDEISKFGWWFVSRKFDERWSTDALTDALQIAGRVDMPHLVVEYLAELAPQMPGRTIDCLSMIITGSDDEWRVLDSGGKAKEIIRTALKSGQKDIRQRAIDLVNLLGSRGYFDFGELLREA